MSRRSDQRRAAVFALYQHDVTGRELDVLFERDASTFTRALAYAAQDYEEDLDARIERHAKGWTVTRIAPLEKAIMRVALLEITHPAAAPGDLQLPASVVLEVTETEPGLRGDTASGGGQKPATLETGAQVTVPLFVNIGDSVKVDTRSGSYMSRA